jgi:hypothetical protein
MGQALTKPAVALEARPPVRSNAAWPLQPAVYTICIPMGLSVADIDTMVGRMPLGVAVRVQVMHSDAGIALGLAVVAKLRERGVGPGADLKFPVVVVPAPRQNHRRGSRPSISAGSGSLSPRTIRKHMNPKVYAGARGASMEINSRDKDFKASTPRIPNPVDDAVASAARDCAARDLDVEYLLCVRDRLRHEVLSRAKVTGLARFPAFVTGCKANPGGPMHFDDYHSVAMVIAGAKAFYILPPGDEGLPERPHQGAGHEHERRDLSPVENCPGAELAWRMAHLEAGDMLYLPPSHWHWVISEAGTVMTNVWYDPDPNMAWFERAMASAWGLLGV